MMVDWAGIGKQRMLGVRSHGLGPALAKAGATDNQRLPGRIEPLEIFLKLCQTRTKCGRQHFTSRSRLGVNLVEIDVLQIRNRESVFEIWACNLPQLVGEIKMCLSGGKITTLQRLLRRAGESAHLTVEQAPGIRRDSGNHFGEAATECPDEMFSTSNASHGDHSRTLKK